MYLNLHFILYRTTIYNYRYALRVHEILNYNKYGYIIKKKFFMVKYILICRVFF